MSKTNSIITKPFSSRNLTLNLIEGDQIGSDYSSYLHDESRLTGNNIKSLFFPGNSEDIQALLSSSKAKNSLILISGARTGVTGGAVPNDIDNTILVSLEKLNKIGSVTNQDNNDFIWLDAGVRLFELNEYLSANNPQLFFPVDPTEQSASVGGLVSTNASGARGYHYGSIRNWVQALEVITVDGESLIIERGKEKLEDSSFEYKGRTYSFPDIPKPNTKNSIGYFYESNMDLVDLFIGSEGTLGIVTKVKLKLAKCPSHILSILQFFKTNKDGLNFIAKMRSRYGKENALLSLEFLDSNSISFGIKGKSSLGDQILKAIEGSSGSGVFFEVYYEDEHSLDTLLSDITSIVESSDSDISKGVCGLTDKEINDIRSFRHAIPENINSCISERRKEIPNLRKIATDMAVPDECLESIFNLYKSKLDHFNLEYAIFGHAGDNHFHVNILPKSDEEIQKSLNVYKFLAEEVVKMGGAVAAEHGIGRIKKDFLKIQYSEEIITNMKKIKHIFDPGSRLNQGVLFD